MELWVKRYLGIFFDFRYFGNLNWIVIPLFIYFLVTIKKRKRWEKAIVFIYILSCLSLEIKGGFWDRYLLTIYPFTLSLIFLCIWELIKKRNHYIQISILIVCVIAIFFNYYHFRDIYKFYWKYKVTVEDDHFPHGLLKYINNIEDLDVDSSILICDDSFYNVSYFYYSKRMGINCFDQKMSPFYREKDKKESLFVLKDQLKIKYVYTSWRFIDSNSQPRIIDIINHDCDLVYQEKGGYLYRLRDRELGKEELTKIFVNDSLLRNGSLENWSHGPLKKPDFFEGGDNVFEGMVAREEKEVRVGKYSAKITGDNFNFAQDLSNLENYKGKTLTCFAWMKTKVSNKYRIEIYDGIDHVFSNRHSGGGDWELLQANFTVNPSAKFVTIRIVQAEKTGKVDDMVYVDGAILVEGDWNTFYLYALHMDKELLKTQN